MGQYKYNEQATSVYIEKVCGEADLAYRFAFTLTLDAGVAHAIVDRVYDETASDVMTIVNIPTIEIRVRLMRSCWTMFQGKVPAGKVGASSSKVSPVFLGFLKSLPLEARSALFALDIAGLTADEAAKVFGVDGNAVRRNVAQGRKALSEQFKVA